MNDFEINDCRKNTDFKSISFSKYPRGQVKQELLKCLYNNTIESSCYWSIELICAGHYKDLWEIIIFYMSKYIHIGNPKLPIYIDLKFQCFKNIINNGYADNELLLRNNKSIRILFAEIICILCTTRKKHSFESLSIKNQNDFDIVNLTSKLNAPDTTYARAIYTKDDPKELFIAVNEFAYHISKLSRDSTKACYWVEWIIQYDYKCKQKKLNCSCERRTFAPVSDKQQMNIIWIIWDVLIQNCNAFHNIYSRIIFALLNLFSIRYNPACNKRRKYILYFAIGILTENINVDTPLIDNKILIENVTNKINIIYKQVKKNEDAPKTEYLFNNIEKTNLDKTIEKLEKLEKFRKFETFEKLQHNGDVTP